MDSSAAQYEAECPEDERMQSVKMQVAPKTKPQKAATLEDTAAGIGVLVAIRDHFAEVAAVSYEQTRRQLASG